MTTTPPQSTVRSVPIKDTAIVNGARLRRMRTPLERLVGFSLLLGSVLGNVLAFNGGKLLPLEWIALGAGIGAQIVLTALQWVYKPHGHGVFGAVATLKWQYLASVATGTGLSIVGYAAVLYAPALRVFLPMPRLHFAVMGISGPILATWALITVVSLVIEVIPEHILVD